MRTNNTVMLVAGREISTRATQRSFLVSTGLILLVIIVGAIVWSALADDGTTRERVGLVGGDASLHTALETAGDAAGTPVQVIDLPDRARADRQIDDGDLATALVVGPGGEYTTVTEAAPDTALENVLRTAVGQYALGRSLTDRGVDPSTLTAPTLHADRLQPEKPDEDQRIAVALVGAMLLVMAILMGGIAVAVGVVEEKTSRIVELLLTAVRPLQLLWGKILGIGAISLAQVVLIGATALIAGRATGLLTITGTAGTVFAAVLAWFLLGYLFFAALYAATGAMVSRQEELNSSTAPLTVLVLAVLYSGTFGVTALDSPLIETLSWIPPFSAVLMPIRIATGDTDAIQVVATFAVMIVACALAVWAAARIYTRSVLRTGSRIGWGEVAGMLSRG
ncbi:ABC transporter permease [Gordonia sp. VNK21]|uniref:ABC transporter permease n=1 Tax=Gordonia sp. VNK21 TaxID=3382483 RepID=UPI0038D43BC7